jgi:16S rRNA (uracil1498-N3)-methyltransferase
LITLLVPEAALAAERFTLGGEAYRHLFRARRLAAGERLRLVDGRGGARWAEVGRVGRRQAELHLAEQAPTHEPARRVELLVALPKGPRAAWLVEKATEVGVGAIRFLASERAPRRLGAGNLERLARVAGAAVEQSHRARLPELSGVHPWHELEALLEGSAERFVLDPAAPPEAAAGPRGGEVALVVGPEGGFTGEERQALAAGGCRPLSLGSTILRVETAAVVGTAWALLPGFH